MKVQFYGNDGYCIECNQPLEGAECPYCDWKDNIDNPQWEETEEIGISMDATEQINNWIKEHGTERDALNVAIARLEATLSSIEVLQSLLDKERERRGILEDFLRQRESVIKQLADE